MDANQAAAAREARRRRAVQLAYDELLERAPPWPSRVRIDVIGGRARIAAISAGNVALLAELVDGAIELFWTGRLAGGERVSFPVPREGVLRMVAVWAPPERRRRTTLPALLAEAVDLDGSEIPTTYPR